MKTQARDLVVLIDSTGRCRKSLSNLIFVPPLRIRQLRRPPDPETNQEEPLVYLLGDTDAFSESSELVAWLDRLWTSGGAPVAILLPRTGYDWCAAGTHAQFCGLLPCDPEIPIEALERVLSESRKTLARRWGQGTVRSAALKWSFSAEDASDPERAWLLLESILCGVIGPSTDLSCLGMAFAEALTNAVEHGLLELASTVKDRPDDGLVRFFEERERRLADPRFNQRRVRVSAEIRGTRIRVRIRNEGRGFDTRGRLGGIAAVRPSPAIHGLGLAMIESLVDRVTLSPDGRTITLFHTIPRGHVRSMGDVPGLIHDDDGFSAAA